MAVIDDKGAVATAAAGKPADTQTASIRYVDRPDCSETFADSINGAYFDGQSLRIEFGITRLDEVKPNTPVTGRRLPAQRMVLTPMAAIELINRMQQISAALQQADAPRRDDAGGDRPRREQVASPPI